MALPMAVSGLNRDRYLINNPIWVDVTAVPSTAIYVRVTIDALNLPDSNIPTSLRLHPLNGSLYFDLSEAVKSFFPVPDFSAETASGTPILTNYENIKVILAAINQTGQTVQELEFTKLYIRGGAEGVRTNVSLGQNAVLKESTKIPRWGAYPVRKYYLAGDGSRSGVAIHSNTTIPATETEQRRVLGCNPIYFKFLNTQGGYSYWLFEKWEGEKTTKSADTVMSRSLDYSLGAEIEYEIEVETRVERPYFKTMRALVQSPEVYVFNLNALLFEDATSGASTVSRQGWGKVFGGNNSVTFNNNEDVKEVKFKFDVITKQRPSLKW